MYHARLTPEGQQVGNIQVKENGISVGSSSIVEQKGVARSGSRFWLLLLGILLLASALRLYALDTYPQRFNQDEMILGYDAWSIWNTGHDHHGALFPIFFVHSMIMCLLSLIILQPLLWDFLGSVKKVHVYLLL